MNNRRLKKSLKRKIGYLELFPFKVSTVSISMYQSNEILGIINCTIVFRHPDIMLRLYKSLVRPHLEYCTAYARSVCYS